MILSKLDAVDFDDAFAIMQESFPSDEYRNYDKQKDLLKNEYYHIYVLKDEIDQNIKAFIAVYEFEKMVFVEHFAVSSKYRNQGLGAVILQELISRTDKEVCLEVEPPETEMAKRRIEFYKRNGFVLNEFPYVQPPLNDNEKSLPMQIMTFGKALSTQEFERVKELLHREVYGRRA